MARQVVVFVCVVESDQPRGRAGATEAVEKAVQQITDFHRGRGSEAQAMVFHDADQVHEIVALDRQGVAVTEHGTYFLESGGFLGT